MSTDLARLRDLRDFYDTAHSPTERLLCARRVIDGLRRENAAARQALHQICDECGPNMPPSTGAIENARHVLADTDADAATGGREG